MRARVLWVAGVALAAAVTASAVGSSDEPTDVAPRTSLKDVEATVGVDARGGVIEVAHLTDTLKVPAKIAAKAADQGSETLTPDERTEYQRYLDETSTLLGKNASALQSTIESAIDALATDDVRKLAAMWAPDENVSASYIEAFASGYPPLVGGDPQKTVDVCAAGDTTVYFTYAVVAWTDAGITSTHTIEIPLRFVDGRWCLSGVGRGTEGLAQVQRIRLP
ncbi:MAG: hypothetical protein ABFC80_05250 [Coriobacteriales bacterium]